MDMNPERKIPRMQASLSTLRKVAGWSAEELGNRLDLTRQSIVNLETGQTKMTKIQYIAFRSVFEEEAKEGGNADLAKILVAMVDDDETTDEDRDEAKKSVDDAVNSKGRRTGSMAAALVATTAAIAALNLPIAFIGAAVATGVTVAKTESSGWLSEIIHAKTQKK